MSDVPSGARDPGPTYPADLPTQPYTTAGTTAGEPAYTEYQAGQSATYQDDSTTYQDDSATSKAKQVAGQSKEVAGQAAADVKDTAKEQAQRVGSEAKIQARSVAADLRDKVGEQARSQNDRLVSTIRETADHLDEMRGDRSGSPAATVVSRVADSGRQLADYLDRNGPEGVLREVQDFARRRPGAFLATALAAGFVVGRLGKGVAKADSNAGNDKPSSDSFVSNTGGAGYQTTGTTQYATDAGYAGTDAGYVDPAVGGYSASTEYAATGTGTPVVVEEDYVYENPERRP
jgi:uncharacterized protein YjbJ (UPF0337 family)